MLALLYLIPYSVILLNLLDGLPSAHHLWISLAFLSSALAWMLFYPLWVNKRRGHPKFFERVRPTDFLLEAGIALLCVLGLVTVDTVAASLWPGADEYMPEWERLARSDYTAVVIASACISVILGPVAEEVFYRGYFYGVLRSKLGAVIACLIQAGLFALTHLYSPFYVFIVFINGIVLVLIYEWRKTLLTPILTHISINLIVACLMIGTMISYANTPVLGVFTESFEDGVRIVDVWPGSGAQAADLQAGDLITHLNGMAIDSHGHLAAIIGEKRIGDVVSLKIVRDDQTMEVPATLGKRQ